MQKAAAVIAVVIGFLIWRAIGGIAGLIVASFVVTVIEIIVQCILHFLAPADEHRIERPSFGATYGPFPATAVATQEAQLAKQHERQLNRLRARRRRRLVFGIVLTSFGGFIVICMIAMFFSSPAPGNTQSQQQFAAVFGFFFGALLLASGIALLRAAKTAKRLLLVEQNRLTASNGSEMRASPDGGAARAQSAAPAGVARRVVACPRCKGAINADALVDGQNTCPHCGQAFKVRRKKQPGTEQLGKLPQGGVAP
jgi:ssDNA-binding Zn-finger/Zn-ribbon topoisomerase 1